MTPTDRCATRTRHPISGTVVVDDIWLTLYPYRDERIPPDDGIEYPWALVGKLRLKFRIGDLGATKTITRKYVWRGSKPYPPHERPTDPEIDLARLSVMGMLREACERHGFEPDPFPFIQYGEAA